MPQKKKKNTANKPPRVKGVSVYRPFVFGSIAKLIEPHNRPAGISPDHTHQWTVYIRGVDNEDITYWLKKVQFKLHETYSQSLRMVESPGPFEVTETGWGEFEVGLKLFFVSEANEKLASVYHQLKLHPYGSDIEKERQKQTGEPIVSQNYEEIIFNEPSEQFYKILTSGAVQPARGKGGSKGSKQAAFNKKSDRTAEIPFAESTDNPYSQKTEAKEMDRLHEAIKQVDALAKEEKAKLVEREKVLEQLRKTVGPPLKLLM